MTRIPVDSTSVAEIGYDPATGTLEVLFRNGGLYRYFDVPPHEHEALLAAASIGAQVNQHIKPAYRCEKVG